MPVFDETGEPALDSDVQHWLVIGNTCDFAREVTSVSWTQLVPVVSHGAQTNLPADLNDHLRRYKLSRQFFVPRWDKTIPDDVYYADFLRPVALHKTAISHLSVRARKRRAGWMLLHCCLVRVLAREDRRFDE